MKLKPFTLVLTAALLAFPLLADDGPYVVIERTYYEQCKNSFDSQCNYLYEQVGALFRGWYSELDLIQSQNNTYLHAIDVVRIQISQARSSLDTADPDQLLVDTQLNDSINSIGHIEDNIARNNDLIVQWKDELQDAKTDLQNHVIATSNSFPYVVATTNLNIYIIVTNSFESATNNYCCCTNEFEHFLNYYSDSRNEILDQYRATVTNFLNQSILADQINKSYWVGSQTPSYYQNINWGTWAGNNSGGAPSLSPNLLWSPNVRLNPWTSYTYRINTTGIEPVTLQEFFTFSLEGIHDSINEIAIDMRKSWLVLQDAMTNTTFSLATVNTKTNEFTQFLTMPETYAEQSVKAARSRNWFQRIELWLSAITRNTAEKGPPEYPDEETSGKKDMVDTATNDFNNASSSILSHLERSCVVTNSANLINTCVDNFGACLAHFKWQSSDSGGGGTRAGGTGFSRLDFMDATWIEERLIDLSPTGEGPRQMPETITLQDPEHGPRLFSSIVLVLDWTHNIFGLFWICLTFFMVVKFFIFIAKGLIWVWWQGLKFFPTIQRYILGG